VIVRLIVRTSTFPEAGRVHLALGILCRGVWISIALTVFGATKRLNTRGDTLNLPLLTVRFSSPMPDVIRVTITHHKGRRPQQPAFELQAQPAPTVVFHAVPGSLGRRLHRHI
jgi:hypothetical protein